jgi:nucleoid-associated protein YgaU
VFTGLCAIAALWIVVYWWWEPRGPRITFDDGTPAPSRSLRERVPAAVEVSTPERSESISRASEGVRAPLSPPGASGFVAPKFRTYIIKPGDTLVGIAKRELGSERLAESISRANPLKDTEKLRAGHLLKLPIDPDNIQGKRIASTAPSPANRVSAAPTTKPVSSEPAASIVQTRVSQSAPVSVPPPLPASASAPAGEEYTVKSGDTLSRISQAHYGTTAMAAAIAQFNGLADPDSLRLGQRLRLPPKSN